MHGIDKGGGTKEEEIMLVEVDSSNLSKELERKVSREIEVSEEYTKRSKRVNI